MEPGRPTTFKLLSDQTDGSVAVFEEVVPPGMGTPLHIHPISDEVIYLLAGEFTFKIGDQVTKGGAGTCVFIPHGTPHGWRNTGGMVGKAVYTFAPADNAKVLRSCATSMSRSLPLPLKPLWNMAGSTVINWSRLSGKNELNELAV